MSIPSAALAAQRDIPRKSLLQLADTFKSTIGLGLKRADMMLAGAADLQLAELTAQTKIPEGEPLLMRGIVMLKENKLPLAHDVYAIKKNDRLYVSLGEFCSAADLAIAVNLEEGTASGWFIREPQSFFLDTKKNEAIVIGNSFAVDPEDIIADENDILVSTTLLEKWFKVDFNYDFSELALIIRTTQPFPIEEKYRRSKIKLGQGNGDEAAKLPLHEEPMKAFTPPYFDINTRGGWARSSGSATGQTFGSWSALGMGDLFGYSSQSFLGGDNETPLSDLRLTLSREDAESNLLGSLHASHYEMGDVNTVNLPLIGRGGQEQGFAVTNKPVGINTQTSTDIRGDAQPGWDVELYRNDTLVALQPISDSGQYTFEEVPLFVGENEFKIIFYGPQGEIREERKSIPVDLLKLAKNTGYYSASLSRGNRVTWQKNPPEIKGAGDPHFAAKYEYGLGKLGTANIGLRHRNEFGADKTYVQTGLTSLLHGFYLNSDLGYDIDGAYGIQLSARRNFNQHTALARYQYNSDDYSPGSAAAPSINHKALFNLNGPLAKDFLFLQNLGYSLKTEYSEFVASGSEENLGAGASARIANILFNTSLDYTTTDQVTATAGETLDMKMNARGFFGRGRWRLSSNYDVIPDSAFSQVLGQYTYPFSKTLESNTEIEYKPAASITEAKLGLNWKTDKATVTPRLVLDNNHKAEASVNVRFGLARDPYSPGYKMVNTNLSGTGGVSARIFLDANGDGLFNDGEEPLPEVEIDAVQARKSATSDSRGIAFLPDIPGRNLTDITVDAGTLPDPYYLSMFKGISIRPRPGIVTKLDYPIVVAGEIDGDTHIRSNDGVLRPGRQIKVQLVSPDGVIESASYSAYDGYFSISTIRPGVYYMTAEPLKSATPAFLVPKQIVIQPNGTTLFGQKVALEKGYNIPFVFSSINTPPNIETRARTIIPDDIESQEVFIRLGHYKSRLAMALDWYKFRFRSKPWASHLTLATPLGDIQPDPETSLLTSVLKPARPLRMEEAAAICQSLQDKGFKDCAVGVVTKYRELAPAAEDTAEISSKNSKT